jgi:DNA-directed RNA polymerase subunit E'
MRQAGLGTSLWLEEEIEKEKEKTAGGTTAVPKEKPEKVKSKRKNHAADE